MMRYLLCCIFCFISLLMSQTNSDLYKNKKLIRIHSSDEFLLDSLLRFNINSISCRGSILQSELIVDDEIISWLNDQGISFSVLSDDMEKMILSEMNRIERRKQHRSSNFFSTYNFFYKKIFYNFF